MRSSLGSPHIPRRDPFLHIALVKPDAPRAELQLLRERALSDQAIDRRPVQAGALLNDVLVISGEGAVAAVLDAAKPYPVKGLYRMSDFPDPPPLQSMPLNLTGAIDGPQLVPGSLMVWTGFAGSCKTSLMVVVIADLLCRGINVAMGSFETMVKPILQTKLRAALLRCSDSDKPTANTSPPTGWPPQTR